MVDDVVVVVVVVGDDDVVFVDVVFVDVVGVVGVVAPLPDGVVSVLPGVPALAMMRVANEATVVWPHGLRAVTVTRIR